MHLVAVGRSTKNPNAACNLAHPAGAPGDYRVTFVLSRPGYSIEPEYNYSFVAGQKGDSHLAITEPAFKNPAGNFDTIVIDGVSPDGRFRFIGTANRKGFLAQIESDAFPAKSFHDAEEKAYRALLPSLSHWSAELDIPMHVYQVASFEVATSNRQVSLIPAYPASPLAILPLAQLKPDFLGYASIYREALSTNSPSYAYLCLYKIIESLRKRRGRVAGERKKQGATPEKPLSENVPNDTNDFEPWLRAIFPTPPPMDEMTFGQIFVTGTIGRSFGYVVDELLRPLRDNIAHALSEPSGELTLSADDLLHTREVNKWLPLMKCIVRRMLKNDFPDEFLRYLKEEGTTKTS